MCASSRTQAVDSPVRVTSQGWPHDFRHFVSHAGLLFATNQVPVKTAQLFWLAPGSGKKLSVSDGQQNVFRGASALQNQLKHFIKSPVRAKRRKFVPPIQRVDDYSIKLVRKKLNGAYTAFPRSSRSYPFDETFDESFGART